MSDYPVEVSVTDVQRLMAEDKIVLIDCRESDEYDVARIDGSVLIPMSSWMNEQHKLPENKDQHIVVHCHHGGRSLRVTNWMRENGFVNTQNMTGGIDAWSQQIDASVPQY